MSRAWGLLKRKKVETDFRLLTEAEVISMVAENAGVSSDVAANALLALDTYENSGFYRSDDLTQWLEKNGSRLSRKCAAQGRGA
ncbi:MAG: hypothetical protein WBE13_07205 [Candidatus Acidiferrum sp.]